jgi:hypothetical protein
VGREERGGVGRGWGLGPPNLDEGLTPMQHLNDSFPSSSSFRIL